MKAIERKTYRGGTEIVVHRSHAPFPQAEMAIEFMSKLALVTACPDGEDAAGRQKLRLMTPEEVVGRACEMANLAWSQFETRGWLLPLPMPQPEASE